jgi:hypothetical protein
MERTEEEPSVQQQHHNTQHVEEPLVQQLTSDQDHEAQHVVRMLSHPCTGLKLVVLTNFSSTLIRQKILILKVSIKKIAEIVKNVPYLIFVHIFEF